MLGYFSSSFMAALFGLICNYSTANAAIAYDIANLKREVKLAPYLRLLNVSGVHDSSQILNGKFDASAVPFDLDKINVKGADSWILLELKNSSNREIGVLIGTTMFDFVSFYSETVSGKFSETKGGLLYKNKAREINISPATYAKIKIQPDVSKRIYIHVQNINDPVFDYMPVTFKMFEEQSFESDVKEGNLFMFLVLGAIIAMALYTLLIYWIVRDSAYIFFAGYNIMACLFILIFNGGLVQAMLETSIHQFTFINICGDISMIFYILFAKSVLDIKNRYPQTDKLLSFFIFSFCFIPVACLMGWFQLAFILGFVCTSIALTLIAVVASLIFFQKKYLPAKYFIMAIAFFLVAANIMILQMLDILPQRILGLNEIEILQAGDAFQLLFFSLALASRYAEIRQKLANEELEKERLLRQKDIEIKEILAKENEMLELKVAERTKELSLEKDKSDELLLNVLPEQIAKELKANGFAAPKYFESVSVLFTDIKNFVTFSEKLTPDELLFELNECFSGFDQIMKEYGIEKIKTIGDSYMAASGIPVENQNHAIDMVAAAIELQKFMKVIEADRIKKGKPYFEIRIGIHSGPIVAGIVGLRKYTYDIWGDTVNLASRMESSGEAGRVNISNSTFEMVKNHFVCSSRGKIIAKGKGEIDMYFVDRKI